VVSCTITFRSIVNKGEDGEPVWLVEINTVEPHKYGGTIPTEFIHLVSTTNLDAAVKKATENISAQINWEPLVDDRTAPSITASSPINNSVVDINSDVWLDIKESLPAAGIDISSVKMFVNDMEVSDQLDVDGDPYSYRIRWIPPMRVYDYYY
jgi:hypothetical protein